MLASWKKSCDKPRPCLKKQRHHFADKGPYSRSYDFSSSYVWRWELGHKETWVLKNWCFWTVVFEKILESPLDFKEIKSVNSKGNQSWIFTERTDAEAEAPILWKPDGKSQLIGKNADSGKDWGQMEKPVTKWNMWLDSITNSIHKNLRKFSVKFSSVSQFSSVAKSCLTLRPHKLQHARIPVHHTPGVHPNLCPSSWGCHPNILFSVVPFSGPPSFPASESFQMS